jgi:site-specific recombinase XerD
MQQLIEQFVRERTYFKNVTPKTVAAYRDAFRAFDGALANKASIGERIVKIRDRGVSAISVNTYLRSVNAFLRWGHTGGSPCGSDPRAEVERRTTRACDVDSGAG